MQKAGMRSMTLPRILVVDPARDGAASLAAFLDTHGCEVRTASDGLEALELVRSWPPDGLVTDTELTNLSGLDLAYQLRRDFGHGIRMVAFMQWTGERAQDLALAAGFDDVVVKPADPEQVLAALSVESLVLIARARQATVQQLTLTLNLAESFVRLRRIVPQGEQDIVDRLKAFVASGLARAVIGAEDRVRLQKRLKDLDR
jgi:CheY-like chemotaxis protein